MGQWWRESGSNGAVLIWVALGWLAFHSALPDWQAWAVWGAIFLGVLLIASGVDAGSRRHRLKLLDLEQKIRDMQRQLNDGTRAW